MSVSFCPDGFITCRRFVVPYRTALVVMYATSKAFTPGINPCMDTSNWMFINKNFIHILEYSRNLIQTYLYKTTVKQLTAMKQITEILLIFPYFRNIIATV